MHFILLDTSNNFQLSLMYNNSFVEKISLERSFFLDNNIKTSEVILQYIYQMLNSHNLDIQSISCLGLINGPGYFTGIRVSITVAKIFRLALKIPIFVFSASYIMFKEVESKLDINDLSIVFSEIGKRGCVICVFNNKEIIVDHTYLDIEELSIFFQYLDDKYIIKNIHAVGNKQFVIQKNNSLIKIHYYSDILQPSLNIMSREVIELYDKQVNEVDLTPLYVKDADMILNKKNK